MKKWDYGDHWQKARLEIDIVACKELRAKIDKAVREGRIKGWKRVHLRLTLWFWDRVFAVFFPGVMDKP